MHSPTGLVQEVNSVPSVTIPEQIDTGNVPDRFPTKPDEKTGLLALVLLEYIRVTAWNRDTLQVVS